MADTLAGFREYVNTLAGVKSLIVRDEHQGVQVEGENGWLVSIFFGRGSYSAQRDEPNPSSTPIDEVLAQVTTSEVAVIRPDGKFVQWTHNEDTVVGYVTADKVFALVPQIMVLDKEDILALT